MLRKELTYLRVLEYAALGRADLTVAERTNRIGSNKQQCLLRCQCKHLSAPPQSIPTKRVHLCARLNVSGSGTHRCDARSIVLPPIIAKLYYCGDEPIVLEPGDGAWIPVKSSSEFICAAGSVMTVQKMKYVDDSPEDHLDVVPGLLDSDFSEDVDIGDEHVLHG